MTPPRTLHLRLLLPFTLGLAFLTGSAWLASAWMFSNALESRLEAQLGHAGQALADGGLPLTREVLLQFRRLLGADIVLVDCCGGPGLSTLPPERAALLEAVRAEFSRWRAANPGALAGGASLQVVNEFYKVAFRAMAAGGDPRYAAAAVVGPLSDARRAARDAAWTAGALALLGTLLFAWIAHRVASTVTRPVAELAGMAMRIAAGEREVRVLAGRDDEVGRLAAALNAMAEEIAGYERRLEQSSRLSALGQMSARVAHEVRNPLTAIKLHLQILRETLAGEHADTVAALLDEVARLELVVSGVLDMGRPARLDLAPADVNLLAQEVARLFGPQLEHRRVRLEAAWADGLPLARLDPARIKQVLVNLLTNACDELPRGGRIALSTAFDAGRGEVLLRVEDSGAGVPEAARGRIFSPGPSAKPGRLGLGLSLSKELVEMHRGRLEVGEGRLGGACFTVRLPAGEGGHG